MDSWPPAALLVRLAFGFAGIALALGLERWRPFRGSRRRLRNDLRNLTLWAAGAGLLQLLPFATAVAASEAARRAGIGLLHQHDLPFPLGILATVVVLDAASYGFHRLYHAIPLLWRLHRVHHSDELLTATTGVRFHPGEILLSSLGRLPIVVALGADVAGILAFEVVLLAASQLQHADVRLPEPVDARLRSLLVTPNLHRIHHSTRRDEADSNFGTVLTIWDRLLRSWRPGVSPESVDVGLPDTAAAAPASLLGLLTMPFRPTPGAGESR